MGSRVQSQVRTDTARDIGQAGPRRPGTVAVGVEHRRCVRIDSKRLPGCKLIACSGAATPHDVVVAESRDAIRMPVGSGRPQAIGMTELVRQRTKVGCRSQIVEIAAGAAVLELPIQ